MKFIKLFIFNLILILSYGDNYYVKIGDKKFPFILKDTAAANELKQKLPFKVQMTNFNNNELYYQFNNKFTTDTKSVGTINTGDIYLYQSDHLVLFYKTFSTSYSYSEIGKLTDTNGLADIIGSNSPIEVEWGIETNESNNNTNTEVTDIETDEYFSNSTNKNFCNFIKINYLISISLIFALL